MRDSHGKLILKTTMAVKVSRRLPQTDVKSLVPDGCTIFYRVHWPSSRKICNFLENFKRVFK